MRKVLIFATVAFFAFYSCKKETEIKSPGNLQTFSTPTISANGKVSEPIGANLAGFLLLDLCSNESWIAIGGTVVFYIESDGNIKPLGVYNFVFQDRRGNIYRTEYSLGIEPFTGFGRVSNNYKLTLNPHNPSIDRALLALMQVNTKGDGRYSILIDSGTIECP